MPYGPPSHLATPPPMIKTLPGASSPGGPFMKQNLMGLLGDPAMHFALGLLEQGGPQRMPVSFGQGIARAGLGASQRQDFLQRFNLANELTKQQTSTSKSREFRNIAQGNRFLNPVAKPPKNYSGVTLVSPDGQRVTLDASAQQPQIRSLTKGGWIEAPAQQETGMPGDFRTKSQLGKNQQEEMDANKRRENIVSELSGFMGKLQRASPRAFGVIGNVGRNVAGVAGGFNEELGEGVSETLTGESLQTGQALQTSAQKLVADLLPIISGEPSRYSNRDLERAQEIQASLHTWKNKTQAMSSISELLKIEFRAETRERMKRGDPPLFDPNDPASINAFGNQLLSSEIPEEVVEDLLMELIQLQSRGQVFPNANRR